MGENNPDTTDKITLEPKHNKSGRIALAVAFSWVGAKLGLLGMVADASKLLKGQSKNFHAVKNAIKKEIQNERAAGSGYFKSRFKVAKYTTIVTLAGMAVGAILGWVRGNRLENSKELLHHPFKSLKIMFSNKHVIDTISEQTTSMAALANSADEQHSADKNISSNWTQRADMAHANGKRQTITTEAHSDVAGVNERGR